jgi:hypothetical protein
VGIFGSILRGINTLVNGGKDILEPVEGMTFEEWTAINGKMASGAKVEDAVKDAGIDMPKWDRINAEWLTRMKNDRLRVLSFKYAAGFKDNASGNLGKGSDITENTFPLEKYAELMAAMEMLGQQGRDAQDILKDFGLTPVDYSHIGRFWGKKIMFSPMGTGIKFQERLMHYREKYRQMGGENPHKDIEF